MTRNILLNWRAVRSCALPLIALASTMAACTSTEEPTGSSDPAALPLIDPPALSGSSSGGIPFGMLRLPTNQFGSVFNAAHRNIWPSSLLAELAAIKSRGGKIVLAFAGSEHNYIGRDGHFSMSMWKARVDRFRSVNFNSYVEDGTIIGHYLIDEPKDPRNWGGVPVTGAQVEEMAAYSKSIWPKMATVVRAEPDYLAATGGPYRNLDVAWAQYVTRKGTPQDFIRRNITNAQRVGLGLITGLNITRGGPNGGAMSASQIESAGSTILAESYPCAFLSYYWTEPFVTRSDIRAALTTLSRKASQQPARSCGKTGQGDPPPPPPPPAADSASPNQAPVAAFEAPSCTAGLPCNFHDGSSDEDGTIASRTWSFGTGSNSTESDPAITFDSPGSYTVTLAVTDDKGDSRSISRDISVRAPNSNPTASFTPPSCTAGVACQFDDQSRDDGSISSRTWSFGDGSSSTEAHASKVFAASGNYDVSLTVTDDQGATSAITLTVDVAAPANKPPTASFVAAKCIAGSACRLADRSSDPDGSIAARSWSLGDGSTSTDANASVTYQKAGTYRVTLTVTDNSGATSSLSRNLAVKKATLASSKQIVLTSTTFIQKNREWVSLSWSQVNGANVDVYWNGSLLTRTRNDRKLTRSYARRGPRKFTYQVCETGTKRCSNKVTAQLH